MASRTERKRKMGHCIMKNTYPGIRTLSVIEKDVITCVQHSGDRYGTNCLRMPTEKVFDSYDAAEAYIASIDRHDYDGIAVKYLDYSKVTDTAKIKELRGKIAETVKEKQQYIEEHSVQMLKAEYIGCSKCGSRLKKQLLRAEKCPLCFTDLRSKSTLQKIASFQNKVEKYDEKIFQEKLKRKEKAEEMWLVKFEYHV